MERKDRIDLFGGGALVMFSMALGLNQVLIKLLNSGLQPVFGAGLRSLVAFGAVLAYALWRGRRLRINDGSLPAGLFTGVLFAIEFLFLFMALDYTTVTRVSIFFYSMPIWLCLGAHFLVPGEQITGVRALGLLLAMIGVVWAFVDRGTGGGSILGDILVTLAAICWAAIGLSVRVSRLSGAVPEMQLLYQLAVSSVILIPLSLLFGPVIRDFQLWHVGIFLVMAIGVVSVGFLFWFWILKIYPASDVASYSFLAPVFGVIFGWAILGEEIGPTIFGALVLVSVGIILINRHRKSG